FLFFSSFHSFFLAYHFKGLNHAAIKTPKNTIYKNSSLNSKSKDKLINKYIKSGIKRIQALSLSLLSIVLLFIILYVSFKSSIMIRKPMLPSRVTDCTNVL